MNKLNNWIKLTNKKDKNGAKCTNKTLPTFMLRGMSIDLSFFMFLYIKIKWQLTLIKDRTEAYQF